MKASKARARRQGPALEHLPPMPCGFDANAWVEKTFEECFDRLEEGPVYNALQALLLSGFLLGLGYLMKRKAPLNFALLGSWPSETEVPDVGAVAWGPLTPMMVGHDLEELERWMQQRSRAGRFLTWVVALPEVGRVCILVRTPEHLQASVFVEAEGAKVHLDPEHVRNGLQLVLQAIYLRNRAARELVSSKAYRLVEDSETANQMLRSCQAVAQVAHGSPTELKDALSDALVGSAWLSRLVRELSEPLAADLSDFGSMVTRIFRWAATDQVAVFEAQQTQEAAKARDDKRARELLAREASRAKVLERQLRTARNDERHWRELCQRLQAEQAQQEPATALGQRLDELFARHTMLRA